MSDGTIRVDGTDRTFHRNRILVVLLVPLSMSLMAVSSINVALPTIESGLGASAADIQWVLAGYALTFGVSLIPAGRAGDVLGRGSVFVAGLLVFTLASLACGLAGDPVHLNAARFVQGVGAGMFSPQMTGMIQQYFSGLARAKAYALFGMVVSVSVAIGPVLAGAIIEAVGPANGWRASFFLNVPIGIAGVALAFAWFPFGTERASLRRRRERRAARVAGVAPREQARIDLDPVGSLLIGLAVLAIMWPFISRSGGLTWLLAVGGLGLAALWLWWERFYERRGRQPMVDLELFSYPSFTNGTAISGTLFLGSTSLFAVLAIMLQSGLGVSALQTGLVTLPNAILSAVTSWWAGRHALTRGRFLIVIAIAAMVLGTLLSIAVAWAVAERGLSHWWFGLSVAIIGAGMGAMGSSNQTLSFEDVPSRYGGTAGGVKQTAERIGTAVGTAMVTAVFFGITADSGYTMGFTGAYAVIAAALTLSLLVALYDQRAARIGRWRAAHPREAPQAGGTRGVSSRS